MTGEAGCLDTPFGGALLTGGRFAGKKFVQVFERAGLFFEGFCEEGFVLLAYPGQFERLQGLVDLLVAGLAWVFHFCSSVMGGLS